MNRRNPEAGVAFILVLTVLLGLLVLAAPFLTVALNDHAVSEGVIANGQAEAGADALLRYGAWWLERTTDAGEMRKGGDPNKDVFATPDWDTEEEFAVPIDLASDRGALLAGSDGVPLMSRRDPRGETWDLKVRDEQSIPNLWSAPPFLIAASLARTINTGDLKPEDTTIDLEDAKGLPEKAGAVWIDGERITYAQREGNTLLECGRGTPGGGRARAHKAETYVIDDRARELAMLAFKSPRAKGGWREPLDVAAAKEITLYGEGALSAIEVDRLDREFTATSWRITGDPFGPATVLRQPIDPATQDTSDGFKITVKSNDGINAGTLVRITDGVNTEYGFVVASQRRQNSAVLTLAEPTKNAYTERRTSVAPQVRHPVNVNSASRDTLKRILTGVQITGGQRNVGPNGRMTVAGAEVVADRLIAERPIKSLEQFRDVLQKTQEALPLLFKQPEMIAVFRNAVDAGDWTLGYSTVPFSFKSYDYFTMTATATVSDKAGTERSRRQVRESVRVAAPGRLVYRVDSQAEFEHAIVRAREALYTTTHPNPVERVNPAPWDGEIPASRIPRMLLNPKDEDARKGIFPHVTEGDVRLWPARMEGFNGYIEHFDGQAFQIPDNVEVTKIDPEGWILENGAYQLPLGDSGQRSGGGSRAGGGRGGFGGGRRGGRNPGGSILGRNGANPLRIDMWYRPEAAGGIHTFYELVGSDPEQRVKFSLEQNGEFRAYLRDRTIDKSGDDLEEACVTVFRPPPGFWVGNTWYHVGMSHRGCKPEELAIWLDGMKRGEARFQTILSGSVSDTDTSFSVERADDWPPRGACWVGREVVEFERTGTTFTAITYPDNSTGRGRRGTAAIAHAAGEPVTLFGYSNLVESQTKRGGIAIPRGGGNLASDLGPWNWASFIGNSQEALSQPGGGQPVVFEVLDPGKPNGDQLQLIPAANNPTPYLDSFQTTGGYVIIVGMPQVSADPSIPPVFAAEFAWYQSFNRSTGLISGLQPVPSPPNPDLFGGGVVQISGTRQKHYVRRLTSPGGPYRCAVFPLSVGMTNVTGYLTPVAPQGSTQVAAEHISLGEPNYERMMDHKIEWIAYYHVDTSKKVLLCDDKNRVDQTIGAVVSALYPNAQNPAPAPQTIAESGQYLSMRGQHETRIFGYGAVSSPRIHTTSEDVTPVFHVVQYPGIGFLPPAQPNQQPTAVPGQPAPGWGDSVTLETANGTVRKRFDVTWSRNELVAIGEGPGQDFSQRAIPNGIEGQRDQYLRLLKFPSGELPRIFRPGAKGRAGGDVDGSVAGGRLDEVRVAPFQSERFIVWDHSAMGLSGSQQSSSAAVSIQGISETANEIPVANAHWYMKGLVNLNQPVGGGAPQVILPDGRGVEYDAELAGVPNNDAGLVQIDDEIIAFRRIGRAKGAPALLDCERGVFNTTPQKHGYGANVVFLDFMPVTMLNEALSPTASLINVASEQNFPTRGGLVLVDRELIHFTEIRGRAFAMPPVLDEQGEEVGGLLRGRFGTTAARHDTESIVIEMPFRYWDRWGESQDSPEISFYQFALNRPGAYFERFGYEERRQSPNVQIVTLVRTEQDVPWCTDPARASPKLMRFENGVQQDKNLHFVGRHGTALEARFYVRYLGNSFDPITLSVHDWKTTPELRWAEVHYFDESQVLRRESGR
jgi:hypothetical protein